MKLIIPMAGRGTRVRPHSHVTPKPLLNVRGKNLVERIVDVLDSVLPRPFTEAIFIIGPDFGPEVRETLTELCQEREITPHFSIQEEAHGPAHAVACASEHLSGEGFVIYADTLFEMDPGIQLEGADIIAWVKEVDDPRRFGIAIREGDRVVALQEKPKEPISNEALIGIYYLKDLAWMGREIDALLRSGQRGPGGEYFLTDVFDSMLKSGAVFKTAGVAEWLDCGTIPALLKTTRYYLDREEDGVDSEAVQNSLIIDPVYVGPGAKIVDSVIGPYVSVEAGARVRRSVLRNTVLFADAQVVSTVLRDTLVGSNAEVYGAEMSMNVGDHSVVGVPPA